MTEVLWNIHFWGFIISSFTFSAYLFFGMLKKIWDKKFEETLSFKIFFSALCLLVWIVEAFIWEFSIPYFTIPRFRKAVDLYFSY
jgi:hypothetical protein